MYSTYSYKTSLIKINKKQAQDLASKGNCFIVVRNTDLKAYKITYFEDTLKTCIGKPSFTQDKWLSLVKNNFNNIVNSVFESNTKITLYKEY